MLDNNIESVVIICVVKYSHLKELMSFLCLKWKNEWKQTEYSFVINCLND